MSALVIARRKLTVAGGRTRVTVSLTKPRKVLGKPAFEVLIRISGAGFNAVHKVLGVDELQALDLALKVAGRELESERYSHLRWHYGMNAGDLGFVRSDDQKLSAALVADIKAAVKQYRDKRKSRRHKK